ncbi:uncharacterized protein [Drosophila suzukii]|uniref:Uncharacterized protein isoform X1 n=1 Tax=Drosophila suzukii TaxID=28584 RepID=A0ABM4TLW2_DROSZ
MFLEVMLDTRVSYREHLEYVNKRASETTGSLCRILLNTRETKQDRRRLLATGVKSHLWTLLWYGPSAFRTISDNARHCRPRTGGPQNQDRGEEECQDAERR